MKEKSWDEFWEEYKSISNAEKMLILERDNLIKKIIKENFKGKKIKILEVGCGYASNSRILNKGKKFEVFCLDSSKKVVKKVNKIIKNTILGDALNIPFKSNSFDIIFSAGLIEHFKNPSKIINEMERVVKKEGIIITFVPGKYSLWQLWIKIHGKKWQHGYEESYSIKKLNNLFNKKKFKIIQNGGFDPLSLRGIFLKFFNLDICIKKSFNKNAYTEIYSIVEKRKT